MPMVRYESIFIDLDDTIWDFRTNSKVALHKVYDIHNLSQFYNTFEEYYSVYSEKNTELWNMYHHGRISKEDLMNERFRYPLQRLGVHDNGLAKTLDKDYLSILSTQKNVVPGTWELLDYLSNKYSLAILSNGFEEVQYKKMRSSGIDHYFQEVILSDKVGVNKPHPDIFKYALNKMDTKPDRALMIGDNYDADILGAAKCGIAQIYYNPLKKEITESKPTHQVESLVEIINIL